MKKKLLCVLALFFTVMLFGCNKDNNTHNFILLDETASYFSDFEVVGDNVYIYCTVVLTNTTSKECMFRIKGFFEDDVKGHLLLEGELYAYDKEKETVFSLRANEKKAFEICFSGKLGGRKIKNNRLLPEIEIIIVN